MSWRLISAALLVGAVAWYLAFLVLGTLAAIVDALP